MSAPPQPARRAERTILVGSTAIAIGVCASLTPLREIAGTITAFGFAAAIVGLHRFGRTGPDPKAQPTPPGN